MKIWKWPYIPDHSYKMLIIGGSGSGKTNALLNLIRQQDSDKLTDIIYLYATDGNEPKYQLITKTWRSRNVSRWSKSIYRILTIYEWCLQ